MEFFKKRHELAQHLLDYKLKYVEENCGFSKGNKVKVTDSFGNIEYGFVKGFKWDVIYGVIPIIGKFKKDGSPSKFKVICNIDEYCKIELIK